MPEILAGDIRLGTEKFDADLKKATRAANRGSKDISKAFDDVEKSLRPIPRQVQKINIELDKSSKAGRQAAQGVTTLNRSLSVLKTTLGTLGLIGIATTVLKLGKDFFTASQQMTAANLQLRVATGSAQGAAEAMAFVRAETNRLAQSTTAGARGFAQLALAAKGTSLEGEGLRTIFSALNELAVANRLSTGQYDNVLRQVTQTINKQRVQTEELIVLAENGIPAFKFLGEAMGQSGEELSKSLEKGEVPAEALLAVMSRARVEFAAVAEEAANTIPAGFARGFNKIKIGFADLFGGILDSGELKRLFSSVGSGIPIDALFPSRKEVTEWVDFNIQQVTAMLGLITALAEFVIQKIKGVYDSVTAGIRDRFNQGLEEQKQIFNKVKEFVPESILSFFGKDSTKKNKQEAQNQVDDVKEVVDKAKDNTDESLLHKLLFGDQFTDLKEVERNLRKTLGLAPLPERETTQANTGRQEQLKADAERDALALQAAHKARVERLERERELERERKKRERQDKAAADRAAKAQEQRIKESGEALRALIFEENSRIANEAAKAEELYNDAITRGLTVLPKSDKERERLKRINESFENAKENIQESLGDVLTDAFSGQLGGIQNIFDSIVDIAARTAGQIAAALVIDPLFDKAVNTLVGDFRESGVLGGLAGDIVGKVENLLPGGTGGRLAQVGQNAVSGAGLGILAGSVFGGSPIASGFGGAIGNVAGGFAGQAVGGTFGQFLGPIGGLIGGVLGSVVSGLFGGSSKPTISPLTSATAPTSNVERGEIRRGPFGFISLFDDGTSEVDAATVTAILSEADSGISRLMTARQREAVAAALQATSATGDIRVDAKEVDDAIAQVIQTRLFVAIRALTSEETALQITGQPYTGTAENLGIIQQRVEDALQILSLIEDFRGGPLTEAAAAIKAINDQFSELASRAFTLGIPTDEIIAEQERLLAAIPQAINEDVIQRTLEFTDAAGAQRIALARQQEEEFKNAQDAGADLAALQRLHALEREDLERRLQGAAQGANQALETQSKILEDIARFQRGTLSGTSQQLASLRDSFNDLFGQAVSAGIATDGLVASLAAQESAIIETAQRGFQIALFSIVDPFMASLVQLNQQMVEFQKLVDEGFISQADVDRFHRASVEQARLAEANRIASGGTQGARGQLDQTVQTFILAGNGASALGNQMRELHANSQRLQDALRFLGESVTAVQQSTARQARALVQQAHETVIGAIVNIFNPLQAGMLGLNQQLIEFQALVADGLIPQSLVDQFRSAAEAQVLFTEANRIASGERDGIQAQGQFAQTFESFLDAATGFSDLGQQMRDLHEQSFNLQRALSFLGDAQGIAAVQASTAAQHQAIIQEGFERVQGIIASIANPFANALMGAEQQIDELAMLVQEGIINIFQFDQARLAILGDTAAQEAMRRISGGPTSSIDAVANAFEQFIRAGNPLTQTGQQLFDLTENFANLVDAANLLGLSTADLEASFLEQADALQERMIEDIDQQLSGRVSSLQQIDDFLNDIAIAPEQPLNIRLDEAWRQFQEAIQGADIGRSVEAGGNLRDIARQQFGSAAGFFAIESEIENALEAIRDREQAAIEMERQRLMEQVDREREQIILSRNSLEALQRIGGSNSDTARGIEELINLSRVANERDTRTQALLERLVQQTRA